MSRAAIRPLRIFICKLTPDDINFRAVVALGNQDGFDMCAFEPGPYISWKQQTHRHMKTNAKTHKNCLRHP